MYQKGRGGALNVFFFFKGVRPGFLKCGTCELIFASERGVLCTEIFEFGGLRAKTWAKVEAVGLKAEISNFFLKRRVL